MKNNNWYVLGRKNGRMAFYRLQTNTITANKAYYVYNGTTTSGSLTFDFSGGTNSITIPATTPGADSNAPVYDLQGRRVTAPAKGIYIKGGKKYVVR